MPSATLISPQPQHTLQGTHVDTSLPSISLRPAVTTGPWEVCIYTCRLMWFGFWPLTLREVMAAGSPPLSLPPSRHWVQYYTATDLP